MPRSVWGIVLGIIAVAGVIGWSVAASAASVGVPGELVRQVAGGGVTVTATLLKDEAEATAIKLALDTHSVNLDGYQFGAFATLRDDSGRTYPVQAVEKASGSGHHRQAVLRFGKASPEARALELVVKDVAGVKERTFRWSLTE